MDGDAELNQTWDWDKMQTHLDAVAREHYGMDFFKLHIIGRAYCMQTVLDEIMDGYYRHVGERGVELERTWMTESVPESKGEQNGTLDHTQTQKGADLENRLGCV